MITSSPPTHDPSSTDVESLEQSRRRLIQAVVATSTLWIVPHILQASVADGLPRTLLNVLIIAGIVGAVVFAAMMLHYHRFQSRVNADPIMRSRLDDERLIELKREAIYRAWWTVVLAIAVGVALAPFVEFSDQGILLTLLLLAVNSPLLYFLFLDRD